MDIHGVFTGSGEAEDLGPSSIGWSCMAATGFIYCGRTYDTEPDMCKSMGPDQMRRAFVHWMGEKKLFKKVW